MSGVIKWVAHSSWTAVAAAELPSVVTWAATPARAAIGFATESSIGAVRRVVGPIGAEARG